MEEKHYWMALNMVSGVGKTLFHRLHRKVGSAKGVFNASAKELMSVEGVGEKIATQISGFDLESHVERELRLVERLDLNVLTLQSPDYPRMLKTIFDPPPVLYTQGQPLNDFPAATAVVGTRLVSSYGKWAAEYFSKGLAERGVCIVSGMARGVDSVAHRSALAVKGKTIAVMGCGLAHTYPPENITLRNRIMDNGTLVSEFPVSTKPDKMNFPARNRVISGLSLGTVVIEAGEKSGALITAQFAMEQGREVFAVPGNVNSSKSAGTNRLIQEGAKLVNGPEEVIEEFPEFINDLLVEKPVKSSDNAALGARERSLMALLSLEEKHIDAIIEDSRLSPGEVSATLIQLELKGLVQQREGKRFVVSSG